MVRIETGGIMRIDCYISDGCGSEEAIKENINKQRLLDEKEFLVDDLTGKVAKKETSK